MTVEVETKVISQAMAAKDCTRSRGGKEDYSPEPSEGAGHLGSGLLACKVVKKKF